MTDSKIRYILSGLKAEIRRETDRERVRQLCIQGMQWSWQLMFNVSDQIEEPQDWNYQLCSGECGRLLPLEAFSSFIHHGKLYHRPDCKACYNGKAVENRKYRKKKIFSSVRLEKR